MTTTERDRLVALETRIDAIDKKLDRVLDDHENRIRTLENKPSKRWDAVIASLISGVIGAGVGAWMASEPSCQGSLHQ